MAEGSADVDSAPKKVIVAGDTFKICNMFAGNLFQFALDNNPGWSAQAIHDFLLVEESDSPYFKWLREQQTIAVRCEQLGHHLNQSLSDEAIRRLLLTFSEDPKLDFFNRLRSQLEVDSSIDMEPDMPSDQEADNRDVDILWLRYEKTNLTGELNEKQKMIDQLRDENQKLKDELNEKQKMIDQLRANLSTTSTGKTKGIQNGVDAPPGRPRLLESEPLLTEKEWPRNMDPPPDSTPTRYDLWYGRHKTVSRLPAWTPQVDDGPPRVPTNKAVVTHKRNSEGLTTEPLAGCGGNVCWDNPLTAYKSTKIKAAKVGWFQHDGFAIRRWNTPSRTRSTTLPVGMKLPHDAEFIPRHIRFKAGSGGAWSCCSRSTRHNGKIAIIPFHMPTCPLCKASRHRGQSIYHDFRLTGERGERVDVQDWPAEWKEKALPVEVSKKRSRKEANVDGDNEAEPSVKKVKQPCPLCVAQLRAQGEGEGGEGERRLCGGEV